MSTTRNKSSCPIFGNPLDLNVSSATLPTREQVLRYYNFVRLKKQNEGQHKPKVGEIYDEVAILLEEIWKKASIPTVHHVTIINQVKREHEKLNNILKSYSETRKETTSFKNRVVQFKNEACRLFDIACCKCKSFEECRCIIPHKVPQIERSFLLDQRTTRAMGMGSVD